jgi:hypothetical protein
MGLVVDSGERRFQNGKWRSLWAAVTPDERGKQHIGGGRSKLKTKTTSLRGGIMRTDPTPDDIDAVICAGCADGVRGAAMKPSYRPPTPKEIEATLAIMRNKACDPWWQKTDECDVWWVIAYDPDGEENLGTGCTEAEARASAWIWFWVPEKELGLRLSEETCRAVPRAIPKD